jgi:hypothetical protein
MRVLTLRSFIVLSFALLLAADDSWGQARGLRRMESRTRPGEIDTAAEGGQAGGKQIGRGYKLMELRCASGEVIAGARIRRGAVLDYLQIACARPRCDGRGCQWTSYSWAMSAGDSAGGEPHPPMICGRNEMISGFRARIVSFTVFDYAADIEFECTPMASPPTPEGFFPAGQGSTWHHPEGGFQVDFAPEGARGLRRAPNPVSPFISCRSRGFGATAVSVGEADFAQRGQRIVQAVSLFCPGATSPASPASDVESFIDAMDQCLREQGGLSYYSTPRRNTYSGTAAYGNSAVLYDPANLGRQHPYMKGLWVADAFAAHVLSLRQQFYGVQRTGDPLKGDTDYLVGFLMRCLREKNLLQRDARDPREWFSNYRRRYAEVGAPAEVIQRREHDFSSGWGSFWQGMLPRSLTMEY